jgi:adenosylhomocysteine nucleosidase
MTMSSAAIAAAIRGAAMELRRSTSACSLALLAVLAACDASAAESPPIAILSALDTEAGPLLSAIATPDSVTVRGIPCATGRVAGGRVVIVATGVGKVNAAMTTTLVVERFAPAAIVFTGIAGALDPDLQPGDVVVGERLVQHDLVNETETGTALRTVRSPSTRVHGPVRLEADPALLADARDAALGLELLRAPDATRAPRVRFGTIATGDSFVSAAAKKARLRDDTSAHAVEMEGAAVAQVCRELGVPFLVVRGVSDRAAGEARVEARRNLGVAARNAAAVALAVVRRLAADPRDAAPSADPPTPQP